MKPLLKKWKLSLSATVAAIIFVVSIVIISIGTTTLSLSSERLQSSYNSSQQFQLLEYLNAVVLDVVRAEASEKQYLLTGDAEFLNDFNLAYGRIDEYFKSLRALLAGNSRYSMLLDEMTESVGYRKSCAQEVIEVRQKLGMIPAFARSKKYNEDQLTKHVEWLAKDVTKTINDEMADRLQVLDRDSLASMAGVSFILSSALLALLVVIFGVKRYESERQIAEKNLQKAQTAVENRETRLRALVDSAPDAIVTFLADGKIESVNIVAEGMFGFAGWQMVGEPIESVLPGIRMDENASKEILVRRPDGTTVPVDVSVSVVNVDNARLFTAIIRDVSERKEVEERVKDFYSMVSHELRTPLASIRTALGIMENLGSDLPATAKPVVDIAAQETDRLIRLINDILDMRKIESGKLDLALEVYDAGSIAESAVNAVSSLADQAHVSIENQIAKGIYEIYCDLDRAQQVLLNLLSNALKYSAPEGVITLSCKQIEPNDEFLRFEVRDHGEGIPKDQMHKLFGRFQQLRSSDGRNKAGSGLGLAIAKAIVEEHKGEIGVESPADGGSLFWFTMPLAIDEIDAE
jgi:PAS domain S-box-containing protein